MILNMSYMYIVCERNSNKKPQAQHFLQLRAQSDAREAVEHRRPQVARTATLQVFYEDYCFLTAHLMAHTVQYSILLTLFDVVDNHANILLSLKNTRRI
jgi:hypothetical protein